MSTPKPAASHQAPQGGQENSGTAVRFLESYYRHHIFFCQNLRENGEGSCAPLGAEAGLNRCKKQVKSAGLAGVGGVRVNKAGCLDRCAGGPVAVVYPEAVWYTYVDETDIDEIVESHLKNGKPVERLMLGPEVGR